MMNPSNFTGFEDVEQGLDHEDLWCFEQSNQGHLQQQQLFSEQHLAQHPDQQSQPSMTDPALLQIHTPTEFQEEAELPSFMEQQPSHFQPQVDSKQLQYEKSASQHDVKREIEQLQARIDILRSKINTQQPQMQFQQDLEQPVSPLLNELVRDLPAELPMELPTQLLQTEDTDKRFWDWEETDMHQDSQHQHLPTQTPHTQIHMNMPPSQQSLRDSSGLAPYFQRFELDSSQTGDVEVDEIQPNIPPQKRQRSLPSLQKVRRRTNTDPIAQNSAKRRRVDKSSTGNQNHSLRVGSASNMKDPNALRIGSSEGQAKCPLCPNTFADSHAVRQHFRTIHAGANLKSNICAECLLPCVSEVTLRKHWNRAHVGELDFICELCGARFSDHRNLSFHRTFLHRLLLRSDEQLPNWKQIKMHKCKLCDFTSDQHHNVMMHFFGAHTEVMPVECPRECGRTFQSMWNAKLHFLTCKHNPIVDE